MSTQLFRLPALKTPMNALLMFLAAFFISAAIVRASLAASTEPGSEGDRLQVAVFSASGALDKPEGLDRWIHMGSNIGHGYNGKSFSDDDPGTFRVVAMEPSAYDYFVENGEYANGTMFSLSVYNVLSKVEPDLNGYSQGTFRGFEIHLIDSERNQDGRQFFMFAAEDKSASPLANQSICVNCHLQEAKFESTFVQFYPKLNLD